MTANSLSLLSPFDYHTPCTMSSQGLAQEIIKINDADKIKNLLNNLTLEQGFQIVSELLQLPPQELLPLFRNMHRGSRTFLFASAIETDLTQTLRGLTDCVRNIMNSELGVENKQELLCLLFEFLPRDSKGSSLVSIASHLNRNLEPAFLYPFLALLSHLEFIQALAKDFIKAHSTQQQFNKYQQLFEGVVKNGNVPFCPMIVRCLLAKEEFNDSDWQQLFFERLDPKRSNCFSDQTICYIWQYAPEELKLEIADHYKDGNPQSIAHGIKLYFQAESDPRKRIDQLSLVMKSMNENQIVDFLMSLKETDPASLAYFPCALSDRMFTLLTKDSSPLASPETKTELMKACKSADLKDIALILLEKNRIGALLDMSLILKEDSGERSDEGAIIEQNYSSSFATLQGQLLDPDWKKSVSYYTADLQSIPPYLLALGMFKEEFRSFIMHCLPYFGDDQLNMLGKVFSLRDFNEVLSRGLDSKENPTLLMNDQVLLLTKALPTHLFYDYLYQKTEEITKFAGKFPDQLKIVKTLFEGLLKFKEQAPLLCENYNTALTEFRSLREGLKQFYPSYMGLFIKHIEEQKENPQTKNFLTAIETSRNSLEDLKKFEAEILSPILKEIEPYLPKEETEGLSGYILELLTEEIQEILGIPEETPAEWLASKGVVSNKDLNIFSYDEEDQKMLRQVRYSLKEACYDPNNPHSTEFLDDWTSLFYTSRENMGKQGFKHRALALIDSHFLDLPLDKCIHLTQKILGIIDKVPTVKIEKTLDECLKLIEKQKELESTKNLAELKKFLEESGRKFDKGKKICRNYLLQILYFWRKSDIIGKLNRYLNQEEIDKSWEAFQSLGIFRLSELNQRGCLQNPRQVYRLNRILKPALAGAENPA